LVERLVSRHWSVHHFFLLPESLSYNRRFVELSRHLIQAIDKANGALTAFLSETRLPPHDKSLTHILHLSVFSDCIPLAAARNLDFAFGIDTTVFGVIDQALKALENYKNEKIKLSCTYSDDTIPTLPLPAWSAMYQAASAAPWPLKPVRLWLLAGTMQKAANLATRPQPGTDLAVIEKLQTLRTELDTHGRNLPSTTLWQGLHTNKEDVLNTLEAAKRLRECTIRLARTPHELASIKETARIHKNFSQSNGNSQKNLARW